MAGSTHVPSSDPAGRGPSGASEASERNEFAALYRQWYPVVRGAARSHLLCDADADDATHNVFLRLWKAGPTAWRPTKPERFFSLAGRNEALKMLRHHRRLVPLTDDLTGTVEASAPAPELHTTQSELRDILERAIAHLPRRCQAVMRLIAFDDLTHAQIADRIAIGVGAVEKQAARGRRLLRAMLSPVLEADREDGLSSRTGGEEVLMGLY